MAEYQLAEWGVLRASDNAAIPADPENIDYAEYLAWVDQGGVSDPAPEPPAPTELELLRASALAKIATAGVLTEEELAALEGGL